MNLPSDNNRPDELIAVVAANPPAGRIFCASVRLVAQHVRGARAAKKNSRIRTYDERREIVTAMWSSSRCPLDRGVYNRRERRRHQTPDFQVRRVEGSGAHAADLHPGQIPMRFRFCSPIAHFFAI